MCYDNNENLPLNLLLVGGTVIDCYPTELYSAEKFKALHGTSQRNKREKKRIEKENEQLFHYLSNAKPVYDRKQIKKDYERNREM